jgi:MFS family permease
MILASVFVLPESPRFLVRRGMHEKARRVLSYVRHLESEHEYINVEMEEIEDAIERQDNPPHIGVLEHGKGNGPIQVWKELWWKGNRARMLIGLGLMFGQNMTGINGVNFYTPTIFQSIGFGGTRTDLLASGAFASPLFRFAYTVASPARYYVYMWKGIPTMVYNAVLTSKHKQACTQL